MDLIDKYYPDFQLHGNVLQICIDYLTTTSVMLEYPEGRMIKIILEEYAMFNLSKHGPFVVHNYPSNKTITGRYFDDQYDGDIITVENDNTIINTYHRGSLFCYESKGIELKVTPNKVTDPSIFPYDIFYSHKERDNFISYVVKDGQGECKVRLESYEMSYSFIARNGFLDTYNTVRLDDRRFTITGVSGMLNTVVQMSGLWKLFTEERYGHYSVIEYSQHDSDKDTICRDYSYKDGKYEGRCVDIYGTDAMFVDGYPEGKATINYEVCNYIDGSRDGECILYDNNDTNLIMKKSNYHNGLLHGSFTEYSYNNDIQIIVCECEYNMGKLHGRKILRSDIDGSILEICDYVNGKKHGLHQMLGDIKVDITYINGKRQGGCLHYRNDMLICKENYVNNKLHGLYEKWDNDNGQLIYRRHYNNGRLDGLYEEWDDGILIKQIMYVNGEKHGLCYINTDDDFENCIYVNGKREGLYTEVYEGILTTRTYSDDMIQGYQVCKYPDTMQYESITHFVDDVMHGTHKTYFKDTGDLQIEATYKYGVIDTYKMYNNSNVIIIKYNSRKNVLMFYDKNTDREHTHICKKDTVLRISH